MADGAATAVLPVAVVCNPMVDCDTVLCIEIIGILADKTGDSIKGLRCLVEKALLLLDPLPTRIDSVIPCQVFGKIILTGMIEHGVAVVGICDRTGDELVGDMELGQADRLAVVVDGLHPPDRIEHVIKGRGVLGVADFGLSGIFGVQDDVGCIFGTHGTEEADGSLLELRVGGIEFRLCLVDLLLRGGHGGVCGILCGLGVRELYIGGCLGGLSVLDSLLRGVQLGDGLGIRLLGRIEAGVRGIEGGLGGVHAGFGIGRGLLLYGEGRLGIIQLGLRRCCSGLRLLELGLALGLCRLCGSEGCLRVRDLLFCRIVLRAAGACLRCGEVCFRLLVGGAGGCGLRIRRILVLLGCDKDGIGGILCRLDRNQLGLGIGKRRVGVVEIGLCPAHGILGVAYRLLGGTDCLRGGAYGICLGLIEGILGILGRLEGGLVRFVLLGCIRLGVCETRFRLLEVLAGGIGGVLALRDLTGVLVHCRSVGCRAGADCRIVGCLGLVACGSRLVVGTGGLIVGCLGGVLLRLRLVDRLLQVRDGLCGGFRAGTGCRAGVGGDRRHHGGVLCAPVTDLGECRER